MKTKIGNISENSSSESNVEAELKTNQKNEDLAEVYKVLNAHHWSWETPNDQVRVNVNNEWISLDGELNWNYYKKK
ncbi:MAG: hypothetical protein WCP69_14395 [Bacteroidota bacterium]